MSHWKKLTTGGLAAFGLLLAGGAQALAAGSFSTSPTSKYATEAFTAAANPSGTVVFPSATYTTGIALAGATAGTVNYIFFLPGCNQTSRSGPITYTVTPSATAAGGFGAGATAVATSGGNGDCWVEITVTFSASTAADGTITLSGATATGATVLGTPQASGAFEIAAAFGGGSGGGTALLGDAGSGDLATSAQSITFTQAAATNTVAIDLNSPSFGTEFIVLGVDHTFATDGSIAIATVTTVDANDSTTYTPTNPLTVTITGNYGGIASFFLDTGACPSSPPTANGTTIIGGSILGSTATFSQTTYTTGTFNACLYSASSGLIASNPNGFAVTASDNGSSYAATAPLSSINYNGTITQVSYSRTNPTQGYIGYTRIVNNTSGTANILATVQSDGGATGTESSISVAAGTNTTIADSTIIADAGLPSTVHSASMQIIAPANVIITHLLVNPDSTIVNVQ